MAPEAARLPGAVGAGAQAINASMARAADAWRSRLILPLHRDGLPGSGVPSEKAELSSRSCLVGSLELISSPSPGSHLGVGGRV